MNFAYIAFPGFIWRLMKIAYCSCCIIGVFYSAQAYADLPVINDRFNDGSDNVAIICTITDKLITIRNANTTIRINNEIHFEMSFEKDGKAYPLIDEKNKSASIFLSDSNNNRISGRKILP